MRKLSILLQKVKRNKPVKETVWSFISKGAGFIFHYLFIIFLARSLGINLFGKWSYFFSILTVLFTISFFGLNNSTRVFVAKFNMDKKLSEVYKSSLKLRLIFSFIFILLYLFIFSFFSIPEIEEFRVFFIISLPFIFLKAVVEYFKRIFQGLHRIKYQSYINSLEYGLNFFLVYILFNWSISIENIIYSLTMSSLITTLFAIYMIYSFYKISLNYEDRGNAVFGFEKSILSYSMPLVLISFGFILIAEIDTIMLGYLTNEVEVGVYAVAKNIVIKLPHIALAVSIGVMPVFSKIEKDNIEKLNKVFKKLIYINTSIYIPIVIFLLLFSPYFIPIIFGENYAPSVLPLQILSIWLLGASFNVFLNSFLDYQFKARKRALNFTSTIALNIILNLILIPKFGATGAALGTAFSYIPYLALNAKEVKSIFSNYKELSH